MKLSEAMMLGSVTCKMEPSNLSTCALGAAANAVGIPTFEDLPIPGLRPAEIAKTWPWLLTARFAPQPPWRLWGAHIADLFNQQVCRENLTYEQLVDYVASVEPGCGECNERVCSCVGLRIEEVPADIQKPLVLADRWAHENVE